MAPAAHQSWIRENFTLVLFVVAVVAGFTVVGIDIANDKRAPAAAAPAAAARAGAATGGAAAAADGARVHWPLSRESNWYVGEDMEAGVMHEHGRVLVVKQLQTWGTRPSGTYVGWLTRVDAQQACYAKSRALCTRDELAAAQYSNCETGWTAEAKGWWRDAADAAADAAHKCGTKGWNGGGAGRAQAYCCRTASTDKYSPVSWEQTPGGLTTKAKAEAACKAAPGGRTELCPVAQVKAYGASALGHTIVTCQAGWARDDQGWWRDAAALDCGHAGWNHAAAADGAFCCTPCPAGYHFATKAEGNADGWCVPNVCRCAHGTTATGLQCKTHDADICTSCDHGYSWEKVYVQLHCTLNEYGG